MKPENQISQLRKGVLELCILSIIAKGDAYASDILAQLKSSELIVVEGTLYPLLTRLKNDGYTNYRWEESRSGPPRKYYRITDEAANSSKASGPTGTASSYPYKPSSFRILKTSNHEKDFDNQYKRHHLQH
jgi:PadR family transcriptional regulator PadR